MAITPSTEAALRALMARPLAIAPEYLPALATFITQSEGMSPIPLAALGTVEAADARRAPVRSRGGTAVIPIIGPIEQRDSFLSAFLGWPTVEGITRDLRAALADDSVQSIVLDIDSPGGTVGGIDELAAEIFAARSVKPITAIANTWMASAAYYLGSQANELVVPPTAMVGSIGVIQLHLDFSRALDIEGVTATVLKAGKYKGEGNPYQPLAADTIDHMEAQLNTYYGMFVDAVARGRGVSATKVRDEFGQGRMVMAREAVRLGMADRIGTIDTVLQRHSGAPGRLQRSEDDTPQITTEGEPSEHTHTTDVPSTEALYALVRSR